MATKTTTNQMCSTTTSNEGHGMVSAVSCHDSSTSTHHPHRPMQSLSLDTSVTHRSSSSSSSSHQIASTEDDDDDDDPATTSDAMAASAATGYGGWWHLLVGRHSLSSVNPTPASHDRKHFFGSTILPCRAPERSSHYVQLQQQQQQQQQQHRLLHRRHSMGLTARTTQKGRVNDHSLVAAAAASSSTTTAQNSTHVRSRSNTRNAKSMIPLSSFDDQYHENDDYNNNAEYYCDSADDDNNNTGDTETNLPLLYFSTTHVSDDDNCHDYYYDENERRCKTRYGSSTFRCHRAVTFVAARIKHLIWTIVLFVVSILLYTRRALFRIDRSTDWISMATTIPAILSASTDKVIHRISSSTELCWVALFFSIAAETLATLLSKHAAVMGSSSSSHGTTTASSSSSHLFEDKTTFTLLPDSVATSSSSSTITTTTTHTLTSIVMANILVILCQCGMTLALTRIDMGIAYSIWAALGTAAVSVWGIIYYQESADVSKLCSLGLIVLGVIGLNLRPCTTTGTATTTIDDIHTTTTTTITDPMEHAVASSVAAAAAVVGFLPTVA
jgi:small multidrug resistance pump